MGYSVKWIEKNLGITRDMIRYYEKENLISAKGSRNVNQYRDYSEEEIERIWAIKLLIRIGFSAKEIYALMHDSNFDFDTAIAQKVATLQAKHDEDVICLEFAKTIKMTGLIPTPSTLGCIKFDDFLSYARRTWNYYDDPQIAPFMKTVDTLVSKKSQEWTLDDVEHLVRRVEEIDIETLVHASTFRGYVHLIADMQEFSYDADIVQRVVHLLYNHFVKYNIGPELEGQVSAKVFGKSVAPTFLVGDIASMYEQCFGKEGCLFIAQAIAYYGGYDIEDL